MVVQGGNNNMVVQGCPITQVMDKRDPCGPGNSPAVWLILNEVQLLYFLLSPPNPPPQLLFLLEHHS